MEVEDIRSYKRDRDTLKDCVKKFEEFLSLEPTCDKHALGFNLDDRFRALEAHSVTLDSWKGYYGNSSSSTYLCDIRNTRKFWKYFDAYLNLHKEEILNFISNKFNEEIKSNTKVIEEEIVKLSSLLQELK